MTSSVRCEGVHSRPILCVALAGEFKPRRSSMLPGCGGGSVPADLLTLLPCLALPEWHAYTIRSQLALALALVLLLTLSNGRGLARIAT